jgi:hypothetical protein
MKNIHWLLAIAALSGVIAVGKAGAAEQDSTENYAGFRKLTVLRKTQLVALTTVTPGTDTYEIVFYVDKGGNPIHARYKIKTPNAKSSKFDANTGIRITNYPTQTEKGHDSRAGCPPPELQEPWEMLTVDEVTVESNGLRIGYSSYIPKVAVGRGMDTCPGIGKEIVRSIENGVERGVGTIHIEREQFQQSAVSKVILAKTAPPRRAGQIEHTEITLEPYSQ